MAVEQQLRAYVDYLRDMGIYDLYRRESPGAPLPDALRTLQTALREKRTGAQPVRAAVSAPRKAEPAGQKLATPPVTTAAQELSIEAEPTTSMPKPPSLDLIAVLPDGKMPAGERAAALDDLRAAIGECTRCPLAYAGRRNIVFGEGNPSARLMFVGEGPGADEDESGRPFVGKAGQLLNNMISAMGLKREEVYIANIVKCRPPANRAPEYVEATTCSQFLARQIDIVQPEVIVALGATAATYLLGVKQPLSTLRGAWHSVRSAKVAVTYHPAFLLRDPRQKSEAWKDLQRVMAEMGLTPKRTS
jgi:DNA polymerase